MSFIEDEEAFGVFDQQGEDDGAMPVEDTHGELEMEELGEPMNQELITGLENGRFGMKKGKSCLRRHKR